MSEPPAEPIVGAGHPSAIPPAMPPSPKTAEELIIALGDAMNARFDRSAETVAQGFKETNANIDIVTNEVDVMNRRLNAIDGRVNTIETWRTSSSVRVKDLAATTSSQDLSHAAALSEEIVARTKLAMQVDSLVKSQSLQSAILERLDKAVSWGIQNPMVRRAAWSVLGLITGWLATKGLHL